MKNSKNPSSTDQSLKCKSRQELAEEYGISARTFRRWLKIHKILLPKGLVKPDDIRSVYDRLGWPK